MSETFELPLDEEEEWSTNESSSLWLSNLRLPPLWRRNNNNNNNNATPTKHDHDDHSDWEQYSVLIRYGQLLTPMFILGVVTTMTVVWTIWKTPLPSSSTSSSSSNAGLGSSSSSSGHVHALSSLATSTHHPPPSHHSHAPSTSTSKPNHTHSPHVPYTLRDILSDHETGFHLAMAPAFFGFYGYFGALAAWSDEVGVDVGMDAARNDNRDDHNDPDTPTPSWSLPGLQSTAGASAGAMAAILLAAGISPHVAADFCAGLTLGKFADFPGFLAAFRGTKFEELTESFLRREGNVTRMEDAHLPVAVSAFDIQTMRGIILQSGSMARAARASATFPGLFQPVGWDDGVNDYVFVDGGIADSAGMKGLAETMKATRRQLSQGSERVISLCVGKFSPFRPPGPSTLPGNPLVISVSLQGLPQPGPWAMQNGPKAFQAARQAMKRALDVPLKLMDTRENESTTDLEEYHYELTIVADKPLAHDS